MVTPYDWQEGIGHRAGFVEAKLRHGSPVITISRPEGILAVSFRRQTPKVYEIYDRLLFAAVGQQSDIEAIRVAALEFAHQEGFNRSEKDVTIQRVVNAISGSIKRAFGDFGSTPVVARSVFAEVADTPDGDRFLLVDYDGDYAVQKGRAIVHGYDEIGASVTAFVDQAVAAASVEEAIPLLRSAWLLLSDPAQEISEQELTKGLEIEATLLERTDTRQNRFRTMTV